MIYLWDSRSIRLNVSICGQLYDSKHHCAKPIRVWVIWTLALQRKKEKNLNVNSISITVKSPFVSFSTCCACNQTGWPGAWFVSLFQWARHPSAHVSSFLRPKRLILRYVSCVCLTGTVSPPFGAWLGSHIHSVECLFAHLIHHIIHQTRKTHSQSYTKKFSSVRAI